MWTLLLALSCTGKDEIALDSGTGTDDSGGEEQNDGVSPEVTDADAYCYLHDTGDQFYNWSLSATYDDPQGLDNVPRSFHMVEIYKGGNLVTDAELMSCNTDSGSCIGSFNADVLGIPCPGSAEEYVFKIIIEDYDGNTGDAQVTGREANADGSPL